MGISQPTSVNWRKDRLLEGKQNRKPLRTWYSESWLSFIPVLFCNVKCSLPDFSKRSDLLERMSFSHNSLGISYHSSMWIGKKRLKMFHCKTIDKGGKKGQYHNLALQSSFKPIRTVTKMNHELLLSTWLKSPLMLPHQTLGWDFSCFLYHNTKLCITA